MADSWIQASFAFTCSNAEMALLEEAFLAAANLADDFEPDLPSPEFLAVFPPVDDDMCSGFRSLFTDPDFPSFGAQIEGGNSLERPDISTVTLFGTTDFDPNAVARLIQRCCRESLEAEPIGFEYCWTCSKPRVGEVGGRLVRHPPRPHRQRHHRRGARRRPVRLIFRTRPCVATRRPAGAMTHAPFPCIRRTCIMTDATMAAPSTALYSQIPTDDRGNFHYQGDLHRAAEPLPDLCRRIERHLAATFPDSHFALHSETFAGGRKVVAELLDHPADLTAEADRRLFTVAVQDQIERFGFTRSNFYQDYLSCAFYNEVRIGEGYWAALATRRGTAHPVEPKLTLAAFRKTVKPGDTMTLVHAPWSHRALGVPRTVEKVRSSDIVIGGSHLSFPRAAGFACDGRLVRIAMGSEREPDAHLLYQWDRRAA